MSRTLHLRQLAGLAALALVLAVAPACKQKTETAAAAPSANDWSGRIERYSSAQSRQTVRWVAMLCRSAWPISPAAARPRSSALGQADRAEPSVFGR